MPIAKRKPVPERSCATCGTKFRPRDNGHAGKYCSQPCAWMAQRLPPTTCEECRVAFQPRKDSGRRFCSKRCANRSTARNRASTKGWTLSSKGYRLVWMPQHPNASAQAGYIFEHRLVMERHIGRPLMPTEVVHHINEVKTDNRIENLALMLKPEHDKLNLPHRSTLICPHCSGKIVTSRPVRIVADECYFSEAES